MEIKYEVFQRLKDGEAERRVRADCKLTSRAFCKEKLCQQICLWKFNFLEVAEAGCVLVLCSKMAIAAAAAIRKMDRTIVSVSAVVDRNCGCGDWVGEGDCDAVAVGEVVFGVCVGVAVGVGEGEGIVVGTVVEVGDGVGVTGVGLAVAVGEDVGEINGVGEGDGVRSTIGASVLTFVLSILPVSAAT